MTAAQILVRSLAEHGVDRVFCVPGESYLGVLDALRDRDDIDVVTCRHEGGAGFMAVTDAKLTGRPGVCLVSRGPGAANAVIAVHTAEQDGVPLVLLVGQVARHERGRGAFQEVDYGKTFADMAKAVWEVHNPASLSETIARAFHVALTATPGPVVVVMPEDMLNDRPTTAALHPPLPLAAVQPREHQVMVAAAALRKARRPLLIAGSGLARQAGRAALLAAAEAWMLPVALSFRNQDLFPNRHHLYAGHLGFKIPRRQVALYAESDLVLAVGTRLGDTTTQGWQMPRAPEPEQVLIHVHADPRQIGRVFRTPLGIAADPTAFLAALAAMPPPAPVPWQEWTGRLHEDALAMGRWLPAHAADGVVFGAVVDALAHRLDPAAVVVVDSGNFSGWVHRYFPFGRDNLLLGAISGAMGLGVPGAVAAGLRLGSGRQIVTFVGDGGFLMTGGELATAMQRRLPVRIFIANNGSYGTIRLHQESQYPRRVAATDLANPDFAALGAAYGARGLTIAGDDDVVPVVEAALATDGPVVVDVRTSLEYVSAFTTISRLHARR